jgi:hypothetical protein
MTFVNRGECEVAIEALAIGTAFALADDGSETKLEEWRQEITITKVSLFAESDDVVVTEQDVKFATKLNPV